jgi:hypothetical protein
MPRNALKKADEYVTNALIGAGYGIQGQLEGMYQMAANPRETFTGMRNMLANPRQIPGMVAGSLADSYSRATSGPLGFGEVVGENLSPSMFRRGPANRAAAMPTNKAADTVTLYRAQTRGKPVKNWFSEDKDLVAQYYGVYAANKEGVDLLRIDVPFEEYDKYINAARKNSLAAADGFSASKEAYLPKKIAQMARKVDPSELDL